MTRENVTKEKGDQGVGHVIATLMAHGIVVALPISEHLPFDLVAISREGVLRKVSVKYRRMKRGTIQMTLRSVWSNSKGAHTRALERGEVDVHAVYCPDTGKCYFVRDDQIKGKFLSLRFVPPKAGQTKGVRMAESCLDPHVMF